MGGEDGEETAVAAVSQDNSDEVGDFVFDGEDHAAAAEHEDDDVDDHDSPEGNSVQGSPEDHSEDSVGNAAKTAQKGQELIVLDELSAVFFEVEGHENAVGDAHAQDKHKHKQFVWLKGVVLLKACFMTLGE